MHDADLLTNDYNVPLVNIYDYDNIQEIAEGSFSKSYQAIDRKTGNCVILKAYGNSEGNCDYDRIFNCLIQVSSVGVCNALPLVGYQYPLSDDERKNFYPDSTGYIVTEFMPNGSLQNHLKCSHRRANQEQLNSTQKTKIIFGIAAIMKKLHHNDIIHRNLKPSQILLDENFEPLIDYCCFSIFSSNYYARDPISATPLYMAPEIFIDGDESYSFPVDVYSYAIILYQMFVERVELDTMRPIRTIQRYMFNIARGKRPIRDNSIPNCYWELIERCWNQNQEERPTFAEITEILKDDRYVLHDCGDPDLDEIHRYQNEIDNSDS